MAVRMAGAQFAPLSPGKMKQKEKHKKCCERKNREPKIHLETVNWFFETIYLGERIGMAMKRQSLALGNGAAADFAIQSADQRNKEPRTASE
jgi:hypothetical protein